MDGVVSMYWRVKRKSAEGTAAVAIRVHAQACGLVAYVLDMHPDAVAEMVAEREAAVSLPTKDEAA